MRATSFAWVPQTKDASNSEVSGHLQFADFGPAARERWLSPAGPLGLARCASGSASSIQHPLNAPPREAVVPKVDHVAVSAQTRAE